MLSLKVMLFYCFSAKFRLKIVRQLPVSVRITNLTNEKGGEEQQIPLYAREIEVSFIVQ
jgi:hypothetical protein